MEETLVKEQIETASQEDDAKEESYRKHINFRTEPHILKELAYNDCVYAWLLLHSHFRKDEKHNYIYKNEVHFGNIAAKIHRSRQTVSKRFNALLDSGIIKEYTYLGKKVYKIPYYSDFEELDGETVLQLLVLPFEKQHEELIKVYAYLLKKKRNAKKEGASSFLVSSRELIEMGGRNPKQGGAPYTRMKAVLTILQGAGIIKFKELLATQDEQGKWTGPKMEVYEVNQRASEDWLGLKADK